ncbi:hypothetical protein NL676_018647 [Syzygium grande]|nr:hypothetical protein NL676_018647 [Syzygium grande]
MDHFVESEEGAAAVASSWTRGGMGRRRSEGRRCQGCGEGREHGLDFKEAEEDMEAAMARGVGEGGIKAKPAKNAAPRLRTHVLESICRAIHSRIKHVSSSDCDIKWREA